MESKSKEALKEEEPGRAGGAIGAIHKNQGTGKVGDIRK